MTFISFAQNREDVLLWRALGHVEKGFYIDIGANDPVEHSVTKAFYDRGWRGLNVEPVRQWFDKLVAARPRDINLQIAAGAEQGVMTLYEVADTGLSTSRKSVAERHGDNGFAHVPVQVQVDTVSNLCALWEIEDVHFLKIDVEGAEREVLLGIDFTKLRPWIVLAESTEPLSQQGSHQEWEELITDHDYTFVHFDGLNRFYLANEHADLRQHFQAPPNVFDDYLTSGQLSALERVNELSQKNEELLQQNGELAKRNEELASRSAEASAAVVQAEKHCAQADHRVLAAENDYLRLEVEHQKLLLSQETFRHRVELLELQLAERDKDIARLEQGEQEQVTRWQLLSERFPMLASTGDLAQGLRQINDEREQQMVKLSEAALVADAQSRHWQNEAADTQRRLDAVVHSLSWRLTQPLREANKTVRTTRLSPARLAASGKRLAKVAAYPWIVRALRKVLANPTYKRRAARVVGRYPKLYDKLFRVARGAGLFTPNAPVEERPIYNPNTFIQGTEPDLSDLSTSAQHFYQELKAAIEAKHGGSH